jgi:hypothetical protein
MIINLLLDIIIIMPILKYFYKIFYI